MTRQLVTNGGDLLGEEGREALKACVKVQIRGRPETRRYEWLQAFERLHSCFFGNECDATSRTRYSPAMYPSPPWPDIEPRWVAKERFPFLREQDTVDIIDIHNALVSADEKRLVEVYPNEGPGSDELRCLIDQRRVAITREVDEAKANPEERKRYSFYVAQRRVRDCYASLFKTDYPMLKNKTYPNDGPYDIDEIYEAFLLYDSVSFADKYRYGYPKDCYSSSSQIDANRADVERQYNEAISTGEMDFELSRYSYMEAKSRVQACYHFPIHDDHFYGAFLHPVQRHASEPQQFTILDIHQVLCHFDNMLLLPKYPQNGPGSDDLRKLIDMHRADLVKEYQESKSRQHVKRKYSRYEAERRVRDCFTWAFVEDTDVFPNKKDKSGTPKIYQTYDIFDIQNAIDHFDSKRFYIKYPDEADPRYDEIRKMVDETRAGIEEEYAEAMEMTDLEHGSGFIVQGHFVITNMHVVEAALHDESKRTQILISNEFIGELPCEVTHSDAHKDLAILYCKDLELNGICPLKLSDTSLAPGMQIYSFGYPISHIGETALFITGYVAGTKKTFSGLTMTVLNCPLNSGNSGGPVLCLVKGKPKVVGVVRQKHIKDILTLDERHTIAKIEETFQTSIIPDTTKFEEKYSSFTELPSSVVLPPENRCSRRNRLIQFQPPDPRQTPLNILVLKLYRALETHSQFNLSNAVPAHDVLKFIKDSSNEYKGDCHGELTEVINSALLLS